MSKQTNLLSFIKKKIGTLQTKKKVKKNNNNDHHDSSRQGSQATVRLSDSEEVVIMEKYQERKLVCPPMVMLSPGVMVYFWGIEKRLRSLADHYSKDSVLDFMKDQFRHYRIDNLKLLQDLQDDQFWGHALPITLDRIQKKIKIIDNSIRLLGTGFQEVVDIEREQVFIILGCMFLGILPSQAHEDNCHFGQLMTRRENEYNPGQARTRQQKLKCILAYFKHIAKNDVYLKGKIRLQRTKNTNTDFMDFMKMDREVPLRAVEILSLKDKTIEDYYAKGIMIDFANKKLGGGVLKNGCVQEEVLFSIFPEAIVSKIICQQLDDNEAVIIYGARRFSNYEGYSHTFEYKGLKTPPPNSVTEKAILVAIDAYDFSKIPAQNFQYSKKGVRREINKAVTGFEGAGLEADEDLPIVTGRWGCGAFKGDEDLKILIQWVAASEANRQMIYITEEDKVEELRLLIKQFQFCCTLDIIGIFDEYYRARNTSKKALSLMDYLKSYV